MQQEWQEPDGWADHYRGFAAESAAVQPETVASVSNLSGLVRSLTRHTDAGLTQAWTEGHTLQQQVSTLMASLGQSVGLGMSCPGSGVQVLHVELEVSTLKLSFLGRSL